MLSIKRSHLILLVFVLGLAFCIIFKFSLLWALLFGLFLFSFYARSTGISYPEILRLLWQGLLSISNILKIFFLIGMLTGIWRLSGTIPYLIQVSLSLIDPTFFTLWCFLLCGALSTLIGTAFGTVSTLGVICMVMARAAGFNELFVGGAILSGIYIGDRCSYMSSSAALICTLTNTVIYDNFKRMIKAGAIPFCLVSVLYVCLSLIDASHSVDTGFSQLLQEHFNCSLPLCIPALIILGCGIFRIDVKISMGLSIICAAISASLLQHAPWEEILHVMFLGYETESPDISVLNGGGIISMAKVIGIVAISSSYGRVIDKSGLVDDLKETIQKLSGKIGVFRTIALTSLLSTGIACNQTLSAIITYQLCSKLESDSGKMAIYLENSVILLSAVLPWSIAFSMASTTLDSNAAIIPLAFYLWLMPIYFCIFPNKQ